MPLREAVRQALRTMRAQKLRSFFSLVGVLIGVTFLVAVVSIVQGMNRYMVDRFANRVIGANTFELRQRPSITTEEIPHDVWREWRRRPLITTDDAGYVRARLRTPATFAAQCDDDEVPVHYGNRMARGVTLVAADETYFDIRHYEITAGRALSAQDVRAGQPVLVVGWELADKLLPNVDPIGKAVTIGGMPYRIVGVVAKQGTLFGLSLDRFAIMPFTAPGRRLLCPAGGIDAFIVQTADPPSMRLAMTETEALMRSLRRLRPWQPNNFYLQTPEGALGTWRKISRILFLALPGLVAVSLVVGGIVIMNIMLMAVSERTREIGIRKALGARRRDILAQFVVESAAISSVGALLGIGVGVVLALVVKTVTPLPAAVAPWSVAAAMLLGVGVGLVAGVYPASRAAKLDPIAALRAE